jgi:DNA-binding PucR family transcriptional regulator
VTRTDASDVTRRVRARLLELGALMNAQAGEITDMLHKRLAESISELQGDTVILELLHSSIASNVETLADILRHDIDMSSVSTPSAAEEYARRLAQRGISSTALVRAYRLGQQAVLGWGFETITKKEPDPEVALKAAAEYTDFTFRYIDSISEQVVHLYEAERDRWLANRNALRGTLLRELISGDAVDIAAAESGLGYRLRQRHLGVLVWSAGGPAGGDLRRLERLASALAKAVGPGQAFFHAADRSTGWAWIPVATDAEELPLAALEQVAEAAEPGLFAAIGTPAAGPTGFRVTHLEATRARQVALAAQGTARRLTAYADPEVRTIAMLTADLDAARRLVGTALGGLAADTDSAARLRETLLVFLDEQGSFTATAERIHLHKNTVKYRVDRAVEERGRPRDDERLELVLALVAARRLGPAVLRPAP